MNIAYDIILKKPLFIVKNRFFAFYAKTARITSIMSLEKLLFLAKLHVFLLLKPCFLFYF